MAVDPNAPARPESAGMYALFETTIPRLKRDHFGFKIKDYENVPRDSGVQDFCEEILGALTAVNPVDMQTPFAMTNNTGGNAIIVNGGDDNSGIQVNNGDGSVTLTPGGLIFNNNQQIGGNVVWGPTINSDNSVSWGPTTNTNASVSNTNITINNSNSKVAVIRQFTLHGDLDKNVTSVAGTMIGEGADPNDVTLFGKYFPGHAVSGDDVLAWYAAEDTRWYAFAHDHKAYFGPIIAWKETSAISATVNEDCEVELAGLQEFTVYDGIIYGDPTPL